MLADQFHRELYPNAVIWQKAPEPFGSSLNSRSMRRGLPHFVDQISVDQFIPLSNEDVRREQTIDFLAREFFAA
jgi:hypothetical protein